MANEQLLPAGYRQGLITSVTIVLTATILYLRYIVIEPASDDWTPWGVVSAIFGGISLLAQLFTLWRSLQPIDEHIAVYKVTLRWFAFAVLLLVCSLAAITVASVVYVDTENVRLIMLDYGYCTR